MNTFEVTIPAPFLWSIEIHRHSEIYKITRLQNYKLQTVSRCPNTRVTSTHGRSVKAI